MQLISTLTCNAGNPFDGICQQIGGNVGPIVENLISAAAVFILIFFAGRVLRALLERFKSVGVDLQVRTLVHNVLTAATWVFAILGGLVALGVNISVLLTFGGLFSLAIGLAFQDVLRNLLAGMFLLIEKPFRLGDAVTLGEFTGTVETIQLRATALKTFDGRLIVIPNLSLLSGAIINQSSYGTRRFAIDVRVPRSADMSELLRKTKTVLLAEKALAKKPGPTVLAHLEGEEMILQARYWLDYRAHDPDEVQVALTGRIAEVLYASPIA